MHIKMQSHRVGFLMTVITFFFSQYRVPGAHSISYRIMLFVFLQMKILFLHFHLYFQFPH